MRLCTRSLTLDLLQGIFSTCKSTCRPYFVGPWWVWRGWLMES